MARSLRPLRFGSSTSTLRRVLAAGAVIVAAVAAAYPTRAIGAPKTEPPKAEAAKEGDAEAEATPMEPRVQLGKVRRVHGTALPKGVESALAQVAPSLEACYRAAVDAGRDGAPSIELRMELVGPGKVASAVVNASKDASSSLRGCVRDAFAGVAAGAVGPEPIEVLLPIAFEREVPEDFAAAPSACPATCDGDLPDSLRAEIRARAKAAGNCFQRSAAPGEPTTLKGGALQVSLRIAGDGSVCGVATGDDAFGRPSLTSCVVEAMSATFGAAPGACLDVSFPLVFKGS